MMMRVMMLLDGVGDPPDPWIPVITGIVRSSDQQIV